MIGASWAKIAPAHNGLRPQSPLALSLGLPISTYWLHFASRYRRFCPATQARFIMLGTLAPGTTRRINDADGDARGQGDTRNGDAGWNRYASSMSWRSSTLNSNSKSRADIGSRSTERRRNPQGAAASRRQ